MTLQAQYVLDTSGEFPGTLPTLFVLDSVQAHRLDRELHGWSPGQAPTCSVQTSNEPART